MYVSYRRLREDRVKMRDARGIVSKTSRTRDPRYIRASSDGASFASRVLTDLRLVGDTSVD